jgi:hypothetical protein
MFDGNVIPKDVARVVKGLAKEPWVIASFFPVVQPDFPISPADFLSLAGEHRCGGAQPSTTTVARDVSVSGESADGATVEFVARSSRPR